MCNTCESSYAVYDKQYSLEKIYGCEELPWMVYTLSYVSTGIKIDQAAYCKQCSLVKLNNWIAVSLDNPDIAFTIHRYVTSADDM